MADYMFVFHAAENEPLLQLNNLVIQTSFFGHIMLLNLDLTS